MTVGFKRSKKDHDHFTSEERLTVARNIHGPLHDVTDEDLSVRASQGHVQFVGANRAVTPPLSSMGTSSQNNWIEPMKRRTSSRSDLRSSQNAATRSDSSWQQQQQQSFDSNTLSSLSSTSTITLLPAPVIYVSHGCLLLPVAFFLWYYWSKRYARKIVRGLLTAPPSMEEPNAHHHHHDDDDERNFAYYRHHSCEFPPPMGCTSCDDEFSSWEDVMENNLRDSSLRYVRWYKSRNTAPSKAWKRLSVTALWSRFRRRPSPKSEPSSPTMWLSPMISLDDEENEGFEVQSIPSSAASVTETIEWRYLKNVSGVELCLVSPLPVSIEEDEEGATIKRRK